MTKLINDPTGLELIVEVTLSSFRDWNIRMLGGRLEGLPKTVIDVVNDPAGELAPLLTAMKPGDQLWRCHSEQRGPLYGHEGIAVVRDLRPIIYMRMWNC